MINDIEFSASFTDTGPITSLLIHPDGESVFSGTTNNVVTQWHIGSGERQKVFEHAEGQGVSTMAQSECSDDQPDSDLVDTQKQLDMLIKSIKDKNKDKSKAQESIDQVVDAVADAAAAEAADQTVSEQAGAAIKEGVD